MSGLKTDVSGLKSDVSELKTDVSELKTDVSELKDGQLRLERLIRRGLKLSDDARLAAGVAQRRRGIGVGCVPSWRVDPRRG